MNQVFSPQSLYGKVAQLVRACGSYPQGRGFNSLPCYQFKMIMFIKTISIKLDELFKDNTSTIIITVHFNS